MLTKKSSLTLALAAAVALALSGCGGAARGTRSMSNSGSMMPDDGSTMTAGDQMTDDDQTSPPVTAQTRAEAVANQTVANYVADAIAKAAEALPSAGSITQSSNVDSSNITTDQVEVTARYTQDDAGILQVRNGTTWSIDSDEGNFRQILDDTPPWYGAEFSKRIEFGVLYVDLYSDIDDDPTEVTTGGTYAFTFPGIQVGGQYVSQSSNIHLPAVLDGVNGRASCTGCSFVYTTGQLQMTAGNMTFTPSDGSAASTLTAGTVTSTVPDADYLAGGVWLIVPDDATSAADYVFGAFGNGSDRFLQGNLAGVEGTATYDGDATGVYSEEDGRFHRHRRTSMATSR